MKRSEHSAERTRSDAGTDPGSHRGVLADLIEAEARIQADVVAAEERASRVIAEAEAETRAHADARDEALDAALAALRSTLARERSETLHEIERRAEETARRYLEVDEARVATLARIVAREIAEGRVGPSEAIA